MRLLEIPEGRNRLSAALMQLQRAAGLIDELSAPPEVIDELAYSIGRLEELLGQSKQDVGHARSLIARLEAELSRRR